MEEVDAKYLKKCLFHKISHRLCPIFNLGYVARESGHNFSTLTEKVLCQRVGRAGPGIVKPIKAFQAQVIRLQPPCVG